MVHLNESGTDQRTPVCKLSLHNKPNHLIIVILSLNTRHPVHNQIPASFTMPKAKLKSTSSNEEELHGFINLTEAKAHVNALEAQMAKIRRKVKDKETTDLLDEVLEGIKEILSDLTPSMQLADTRTIAKAIRDKYFHTLLTRSDELEETLQEILPDEELPGAPEVIRMAEVKKEMSKEDKILVAELFSNLEVAHDHMGYSMWPVEQAIQDTWPPQLLTIVQASIRPLIQLKELSPLEVTSTQKKTTELPDEQEKRVEILLTPDPQAPLLRKEKANSETRLLAVTYAFKILSSFGSGTTQKHMQETYTVKAKQLAACLTGRKYLGGSDR